MVEYKGIDKVDAQALSAQRSLTEALWLTLQSQGVEDRTYNDHGGSSDSLSHTTRWLKASQLPPRAPARFASQDVV